MCVCAFFLVHVWFGRGSLLLHPPSLMPSFGERREEDTPLLPVHDHPTFDNAFTVWCGVEEGNTLPPPSSSNTRQNGRTGVRWYCWMCAEPAFCLRSRALFLFSLCSFALDARDCRRRRRRFVIAARNRETRRQPGGRMFYRRRANFGARATFWVVFGFGHQHTLFGHDDGSLKRTWIGGGKTDMICRVVHTDTHTS